MILLVLVLILALSAAFHTMDHSIVLDKLHNLIGLSGTVLNWFKSYLTDRNLFVCIEEFSSIRYKIKCGVLQG